MLFILLGVLRVGLDCAFGVCVFPFFFFFFCTRLWDCGYCSWTIQWTVAAKFDFSIFFSQSVHIVHCSWTHKFHFSATFSLKIGLTVLFTHLKLFCYSIFQFSVSVFSFQLYPNGPLVELACFVVCELINI